MRTQRLPQRFLAWLMACVMALTCAPQALAEDSAKATTMQLQKTEGTVAISNASGKSVPTRDSLRLYNGYRLETEEASYAWINLDKSKLVKEDAVSEISIRKSGKKLDILVDSGNLFFNVSEPLEDDESLNIHTSTMVVGVRGTSGWVKVIDQWTSVVYILEGTVEVTVTDPVTGETKSGTVRGGETASCVVYPQDRPGSKCDILRQTYTEGDIDGFVLVELTPDAPLCEKVLKETGLDLRGPGVKPEERLKKDQAEVREKLEQIADQVQKQDHNVSTEPVWTAPASDSAKPSGSTGSSGGAPAPAPTETVTLTMPQTAAAVNSHLSRGTVRQVNLVPGTRQTLSSTATDLDVDTALTVPAGKILTLQSGVGLTASDGGLLTVRGTLTVDGDFRLSGDLGAGSQNGVIKAKAFKLAADVVSWKVPAATDSEGFYTLAYSPKGAYTVTFNANGGTTAPAPMKTGTDGRLTALPDASRTGYTFEGWYTSLTGGELVDTSYVFTRDTTVYARWTENAAPVTGTAGANITWRYDPSTKTLSFTGSGAMTGYGAATDASGATVTNTPWEQYRPEIQSVVIGSGITSIGGYAFTECPKLTDATIPGTVTDVSGYAFFGSGSLKDVYYDGTEAQWNTIAISSGNQPLLDATKHFAGAAGAYTITFDANGGSVSPTTATTGTDGKLASLPVPTREGYTFNGWFTAASDGTQVTVSTVFRQDTTIYAQWTEASAAGVTWRIENGTLYIEGSGPMDDYTYTATESIPWYTRRMEIQSIEISEGITSIGDYSFYLLINAASVSIPTSVTKIGVGAFSSCSSLTSVTIPGSVDTINAQAFSGSGLTSVTIENGVSQILGTAFERCKFTNINIPASVTFIVPSAFWANQNLTSITVDSGNSNYTSSGGVLYTKDMKTLVMCPEGLTTYTVLDGVTTIGPNACGQFSNLTRITIPSSVTRVENNGFSGCKSLTDVYFGGTRAQWNAVTVSTTGNDPLTTATIHCTDDGGETGVTWRIDGTTLYIEGSGAMESVEGYDGSWPWDGKDIYTATEKVIIGEGVTNIGATAFHGSFTKLSSVAIPSSVTTIGDNAFSYSGLTSVTIPNSVTSIGERVFMDCGSLSNVSIPSSVTSIGEGAFMRCSKLTNVTIPNKVTVLNLSVFASCSSLTSVTIPNGVTSIGDTVFASCKNLTSVTIPNSVTSIGKNAFYYCDALTDVYFSGTQAQWNAISGINNAQIPTAATIHYNSPMTRSVVNDAAPGYTDVPEDAWYAEAVAFCRENGLMNGTSATEFSPDATLTRAMMVTVLHRLAGLPAAAAPASFADVPAGQWYTEAVSWASGQGIVLGYDGVTFGVDDPVTHEQAGLIFQRYTGGPGVQIPGADAPQAPATRAEIASALMDCARTQAGFASRSAINVMCAPSGIALDRDGSLLVTDVYGKRLWKVLSRSGTVYAGGETVQGLYGEPVGGYNDASLADSYFKEPWAVAPFLDGWAVSDTENGVVRLIQGGSARTLNGATKEQLKVTELGVAFDHPTGLAADDAGNLYISDTGSGAVRKITPEGAVTTAAKGLAEPMGLCWKDGALYIAEAGKNRVVTLADGKVTVLAGSGEDGLTDGDAKQAAFSAPQGVAVGTDGSVYVADTGNGAVRVIRGGTVTTLTAGGLMTPRGLLLQGGSLYVCDPFARKIFVIAL